jgi:hypothetical protein
MPLHVTSRHLRKEGVIVIANKALPTLLVRRGRHGQTNYLLTAVSPCWLAARRCTEQFLLLYYSTTPLVDWWTVESLFE